MEYVFNLDTMKNLVSTFFPLDDMDFDTIYGEEDERGLILQYTWVKSHKANVAFVQQVATSYVMHVYISGDDGVFAVMLTDDLLRQAGVLQSSK